MARVLEGTRRLPPLPNACRREAVLAYGRVAPRKRPNRPFLPGLARHCFKVRAVQERGAAQLTKQVEIASPQAAQACSGQPNTPQKHNTWQFFLFASSFFTIYVCFISSARHISCMNSVLHSSRFPCLSELGLRVHVLHPLTSAVHVKEAEMTRIQNGRCFALASGTKGPSSHPLMAKEEAH